MARDRAWSRARLVARVAAGGAAALGARGARVGLRPARRIARREALPPGLLHLVEARRCGGRLLPRGPGAVDRIRAWHATSLRITRERPRRRRASCARRAGVRRAAAGPRRDARHEATSPRGVPWSSGRRG